MINFSSYTMIYKISFLGQGYNVVLQVDVILQNYIVVLSSPIFSDVKFMTNYYDNDMNDVQ